jgi:hypothetical protein
MKALKEQDVTRYLLFKQHLLEPNKAEKVPELVRSLIALHATSAVTPYLSLFARMQNFHQADLDRALYVNRELIRLEVMRGTLFITTADLAPILFQATRIPEAKIAEWVRRWGMPPSEYQTIVEYVSRMLQDSATTLPTLKRGLPPGLVRMMERRVGKTVHRLSNVNIVLTALMRMGVLVSEKFSEPILTRQANRYGLIRELYPQIQLSAIDRERAKTLLIKRYITTFGPVTEKDIVWWSGLTKTDLTSILSQLDEELLSVRIKGLKDDYYMHKTDYAKFRKVKLRRQLSIVLLPYEDPYTKGYQIRNRLIDEDLENRAYTAGAVQPTIVINGEIVGIWDQVFEQRSGIVKFQLFRRLSKGIKQVLIEQIQAIAKMMGEKDIRTEFHS